MKIFAVIIIFSFSLIKVSGQEVKKQDLGSFAGIPQGIDPSQLANWKALDADVGALWGIENNIKGNAFYNEKWNNGYILLQDKRIQKNVPMNFNIYTNEIYYLFDSVVLVLNPSLKVSEFGMDNQKSDLPGQDVFRCGYPAVDNNTIKTFYNVIVNNKIALLRYYNKKIIQGTTSLGAPEKKFIDSESWYVYVAAENKIIPIKKNKNSLVAALPQYANTIESLVQDKKLKLKKEDEWVILFNEINKTVL